MIEIGLLLHIIAEFGVFLIITLSLNLEVGQTGIPQFGRLIAVIAGAMAVGAIPGRILAYTMGLPYGPEYGDDRINVIVVGEINRALAANVWLSIGLFFFYLAIAAAFGAFIGWLTSRPAIRLREAYLGISLLAFGDTLQLIGYYWEPLIGGTIPVGVPDPFRFVIGYRYEVLTIVILVIALFTYAFVEMLSRSPFGRTLRMLRDCELAATVFGKDIVKVGTRSLIIGSAIAAMGGGLYAIYMGVAPAAAYTRLTWTFWPWAFMMLGGIGNHTGMIPGVLVFITLRTFIIGWRHGLAPYVPFDPLWLEFTFLGLALVLIVLFRPHGLLPEKPTLTLPRERALNILKSVRER